jgi:hypothetical protein
MALPESILRQDIAFSSIWLWCGHLARYKSKAKNYGLVPLLPSREKGLGDEGQTTA